MNSSLIPSLFGVITLGKTNSQEKPTSIYESVLQAVY